MNAVRFTCGDPAKLYSGWGAGEKWNGWDVVYADWATVDLLLSEGPMEYSAILNPGGERVFDFGDDAPLCPSPYYGPDGYPLYDLGGFCCQIERED